MGYAPMCERTKCVFLPKTVPNYARNSISRTVLEEQAMTGVFFFFLKKSAENSEESQQMTITSGPPTGEQNLTRPTRDHTPWVAKG